MKKKAAIELSMNFLVGIILAIAIFYFDIYFLGKIMSTDIEAILPDYYAEEAKACASRGDRLCIIEKRLEIRVRKYGSFGLVVNNMLGEEANFKPIIDFSLGVLDNEDEVDEIEGIWTQEQVRAVNLENNDYELVSLPFTVPGGAKAGDYIFNVYVCYDSNDEPSDMCPTGFKSIYGPVNQITIFVP